MEHITGNIDRGYDNIEIEKLCRWIYLPTPMILPKVLSQEILRWMTMDNYEAAIDSQMEDAQEMQIETCAYRNCGYLFVDIQFHWQYHPQHIRPNTIQADMIDKKDTEEKLQEVQIPCEKSDQVEDRDSEKTLNYRTSKQDNIDDHMDDESKGRLTKETEINASAKPLEIS